MDRDIFVIYLTVIKNNHHIIINLHSKNGGTLHVNGGIKKLLKISDTRRYSINGGTLDVNGGPFHSSWRSTRNHRIIYITVIWKRR